MDPNATLESIQEALAIGDYDTVDGACEDLNTWIRGGGFSPDWNRCPDATAWFTGEA